MSASGNGMPTTLPAFTATGTGSETSPQFPVHADDDEIVLLVSPADEIAAIDAEVARLESRQLDPTPFVTESLDLPMRLANRELIAALLLRRSRLSRQLEPR